VVAASLVDHLTDPYAVDDSLTRSTFDELPRLANDGHLDGVTYAFVQVVVAFFPGHLNGMRIST